MKLSSAIRNVMFGVAGAALNGCALTHSPVLFPSGPVGMDERNLMFAAIGLMLIVIVPVWIMVLWFAIRYRASNGRARYAPNWSYSGRIDLVIWLVPGLIVTALGYLIWTRTPRLDPYAQTAAGQGAPLTVQVVAEDWKWLFIYPQQDIASVNELVIPVGRPVRLQLTSDTVMNAFYVPGLAGQIYAMAGMRSSLNLRASKPAQLTGRNMQYSGYGFAAQRFAVKAVSRDAFDAWVATARNAPKTLNAATYADFSRPSANVPVTYYYGIEPGLFAKIVAKNAPAAMKRASAAESQ